MTPRIAHVVPDSPFLPFIVDIFESVAPGTNTFLVYGDHGEFGRHAISTRARLESVGTNVIGHTRISEVVNHSDIVISHGMGRLGQHALLSSPHTALKVWSGWGGEYYGSDFSSLAGLLGPATSRYHRSRQSFAGKTLGPVFRFRANTKLHAVARVTDVFSAPIPEDLDVFAKRFRGFRGRYSQLNYASVEDAFSVGSTDITGNDILVGNSASIANNHFEVIELLATLGVSGRRVIVPLSYGDPAYARVVVARGTELLGSSFVPLLDFLPIEEYQSIVSGCNVVVMGHRRQQGIGNIARALWAGAHVFLDERNTIATFLRARHGASGTLGELASGGFPDGRATDIQLRANRQLLQEFWGRSTVLRNVEELIALAK